MNEAQPDFLQNNVILLQQHRPELLAVVGPARQPLDFTITASADGRLNIQAPHPVTHTPEYVHETAQSEAGFADLLALLAKEENAIIFLLGMGLAHEIKLLLRKFPRFRYVVLEPYLEIFAAALRQVDLSFLLASPNVVLRVGSSINISQLLQQEDDALRALPMHLVAQQKLQELFPDTYNPLHTRLQSELVDFQGKLQTIAKQGSLLFQNTLANVPRLSESASIQAIRNIAQGLPAVCVAAGPSLTKNVALLKGQENRIFIIAVDSAAKVLVEHGITPHLIVTIDPIAASLLKLREIIARHDTIALAWTPEAFPETVQGFHHSPKFVIPGVNDLFRLYLAPLYDQGETFPQMLSVTHAATQLARVAGCNPLIFIGLDLALSGEQDHAEGSPVSWKKFSREQRIRIPGWHGDEVETIAMLRNQLFALQNIISQNKGTRYIDATEGGALIAGTEVMPLQEALARYADKQMAFATVIGNVFHKTARPSCAALVHRLRDLQKAVASSRHTAQEGLKNGQEARKQWKIARMPNKKAQAIKKFKKAVIASGKAFDRLMDLLDLANALYPLRAAAHHEFIYARKQFNEAAGEKNAEQSIFEELDQNLAYFSSWIATTREAETMIAPIIQAMTDCSKAPKTAR
ncbi:MAG: motility associated factor glycosyltransferase family protein [Chloroflexota bacterium]